MRRAVSDDEKTSQPLTLVVDHSGMGTVWSVQVGDVRVWGHAAIEGPWPSAETLLRAIFPEQMGGGL